MIIDSFVSHEVWIVHVDGQGKELYRERIYSEE
jgi:hypothetical protein